MKHAVVRPVAENDLVELQTLARSVRGLTTLPHDTESLQNKIDDSLKAFNPKVRKPGGESYLFVLENLDTGRLLGTSGIVSKVGGFDPFYTYKIKTETLKCDSINVVKHAKVLWLHANHNGPSEMCSLLVSEDARRHGLGRLISLARFLFMAEFSGRFDKHVIAEMRGVDHGDGQPPFWECVGSHFFGTDFYTADAMTGKGDKTIITDLMPRHPLYIELLPQSAQDVIGKVHENTKPALKLLESEGFVFHDEVDIFDAGPTLTAPLKKIRTVGDSRKAPFQQCANTPASGFKMGLFSNAKLDFRCVVAPIVETKSGTVELDEKVVAALALGVKDEVRYVTLK